jgi:carboxypeptidase Q
VRGSMLRSFPMLLAMFAVSTPAGAAAPAAATISGPFDPLTLVVARNIRDHALTDDTGYDILRSLTTEVGPRSAGSAGDGRAIAWALGTLYRLGFQNVHAESVTVPHWIRGEAHVEITAPWPQPLAAVALGGCVGTPPEGIEAEVVQVTTLGELPTLKPEQVRGRIVFFDGRMARAVTGSEYGRAVAVRGDGPAQAARLGAVAVVIRSVGTDKNRLGHTGSMHFEKGDPEIPGLALSNPDADLLERQLASGRTVRLRIRNTSQWADSTRSANVIGEFVGRAHPNEVIVLGAHLDSWDLGQGAEDDGAGVAIVTAAAHMASNLKIPIQRTIRVVLFANEEFGLSGARGYASAHAADSLRFVLGMESDLGAYRVRALSSRVPLDRLPRVHQMHALLEPLGVTFGGNEASGDADVGQLRELGVPVIDLETDASEYFDWHHTANDTFDKVDSAQLRQNVACFATLAYLMSEMNGDLGRAPRGTAPAVSGGRPRR